MKIALYHDLPAGGALRFVRDSVRSTNVDHRYVMFVAAGETVDPVLADAVDEVRCVPVPHAARVPPGRLGALAAVLAGQRAVARAIDDGEFDLALFHPSQHTQAPWALASITLTPTLYFAQEPRRRSYERGYQSWTESRRGVRRVAAAAPRALNERFLTTLDRTAVEHATVIAANSAFSVESIARAYGRDARLCHLGVPVGDEPLLGETSDPMLLSVGALDPTKGHDFVVEALGLVPAADRPALTVVHERVDPRFGEHLWQRARHLGVQLTIRRTVTDTELARLYRDATATVAAARLEPFGLTPLESMAQGTPVLALREGGYRETVTDGVNGVLVDRDVRSFAAGITAVAELARLTDPETIRKSLLPYWSWDRCIVDFRRLLDRVVSS